MYTGFNLKNITIDSRATYVKNWKSLFDEQKTKIRSTLNKYITQDGAIDGSKIQEDWFPEVAADIFISHSHTDEKLAVNLACWLYETFNLVAFIDSCVWGYANDLLRQLDNKYCWKEKEKLYDYDKRNYSTSHVHMMLMTALNKMINKTECIFFLNTENSVLLEDIKNKTLSPWIYGEIEITRTIQKRRPQRHLTKLFDSGGRMEKSIEANESLKINYPLNLGHFNTIDNSVLATWRKSNTMEANALDKLYEIAGLKSTIL